MSAHKLRLRIGNFANALARLHEVIAMPMEAPLVLDAAIQRFEFTFETAWKCFKAAAESRGTAPRSPRDAIKQAFAMGWIADEAKWIGLMEARNETSHVYNEAAAALVFQQVKRDLPALDSALTIMQKLADEADAGLGDNSR